MSALPAARVVLRRCLVQTSLPYAAMLGLAALGAASNAQYGEPSPAAQAMWLHLPAFTAALGCGWTALASWPAFAARAPGIDWIARLRPDAWLGCGGAMLGALAALALFLLPLGLWAAATAPVPSAWRALAADGSPILDAAHPMVTFRADGSDYRELRLRPFAFVPPADPVPTTIEVALDGVPLTDAALTIAGTRDLLPLPFAPRAVHTITVRRTAGNLPLLFADDGALLIEAMPRDRWTNGLLAMQFWLLPLAVALALATLAAPAVALPINGLLLTAALLVQTLGELGPVTAAIAALLRGRWLAAEAVFRHGLPSLGTGVLCMIAAMLLRGRLRR